MTEDETNALPHGVTRRDSIVRLMRRVDKVILYATITPIMALSMLFIGGAKGLGIGVIASVGVWWIVRLVFFLIASRLCTKDARTPLAMEIRQIFDRTWEGESPERALDDLRALVSLHGEDFQLLLALGGILVESDRPAEALTALDRAIELGGTQAQLVPNRAVLLKVEALRQLGRLDEAHTILMVIVEVEPTLPAIFSIQAKLFADLGRFEEGSDSVELADRRLLRFPLSLMITRALRRKMQAEVEEARCYVADKWAEHETRFPEA